MRFHTRPGQMIATGLCIAGVLLCTSIPASATLRQFTGRVAGVRSSTGGTVHIFLSANAICSGGGRNDILRVEGVGTELIHAAALEALLRQRLVVIQYDDQRTGNYCNLSTLLVR